MVEKGLAAPGPTVIAADRAAHARREQWAVMGGSFVGNKIVLVGKFDPNGRVAARRARRRST